jgi:hypothetical protein
MRPIAATIFCSLTLACNQKEPSAPVTASSPQPTPKASAAMSPAARAPMAASAPSEGPLSLDEARFQKWVEFRKEFNVAVQKGMSITLQAGSQKPDQTAAKTVTDIRAMGQATQEMTTAINSLRSKFGFPEPEDSRIWKAAMEVAGAKASEGPLMAPTMEMMRKMAKEPGPAQANAEKFLKEQTERSAKEMADAKAKYGDAAIDVLAAHVAQLNEMQKEAIGAAFGRNAAR